MKTFTKTYCCAAVALTAVQQAFCGAATNPPAAPPAPVSSVFTMPSNSQEGRDPFFPESTRPYQAAITASRIVMVTDLKVKGYYHDARMSLITINNHTFAVGDEADLLTTSGRVHVRCVEIRPDAVVIEANGQRQELHF
jgi:hypothetical protein